MSHRRPRLPLRTWLSLSHLVVFVLPVLVLLGSGALATDLRNQTRWDLEHQAAILSILASDLVRAERATVPDADLTTVADALSERLRTVKTANLSGHQVTDRAGVVVASSGGNIGHSLADAPEVVAALAGSPEVVVRRRARTSAPISSESRLAAVRLFVAVPIEVDGERIGALVVSRTPREELQALYHMARPTLIVGVLAALALTVTMALFAGWLLSRSLRVAADGAERIADGAFDDLEAMHTLRASRVAEVGRLAGAVSTMTDRLQARLAYISEFASNVSHEFKTPLSTIRGTLELLGDDDDMPPAQRARFLRNATAELDRLERLVSGLLSLARAEEARERATVDLQPLLRSAAERNGVALAGRAGGVLGDRVQLEAVAENLLANARRHGGPTVSLVAFEGDGETGFEVVDDGEGISPANQGRVFDRFFTTRRGTGGTGLGLALVRAVVRAHGGEVTLQSAPGRTVFRVALPSRPG